MVFSHHYENFIMDTIYISRFFSAVKIENFHWKNIDIFSQNIGCGYMLELPWLGISNTHNPCFVSKIRKIGIPPANSSFSIYRSGVYGGIHIIDMLFLMLCKMFKFFSDSNVTLITKH